MKKQSSYISELPHNVTAKSWEKWYYKMLGD